MASPTRQDSLTNSSQEATLAKAENDGRSDHSQRLVGLETNTDYPFLNRDLGITLYRDMVLGRRFEDKCAEMYYRGKMFGFVHLYNGQEAVSTGVIKASRLKHDWYCST